MRNQTCPASPERIANEESLPASRWQDGDPDEDETVPDAMQESLLATTPRPAAELDGQEELAASLAWVSLDAPRGLLTCKSLSLEVPELTGVIRESRVVRVMRSADGTPFCGSSNRNVADVGRPGRDCASCEDRGAHCFPRWWIAWQEAEAQDEACKKDEACEKVNEGGQVLAHTLSQTGTQNFTRYVAKLQREGLTPARVVTRLFVEETGGHKPGTASRHVQFEKLAEFEMEDPFAR